jgi:hypothetical protein
MKRLFIPVALLAGSVAVGCADSGKQKPSAIAAPSGAMANSASLAPTGGGTKIPQTPAERRGDPVYSYVDEARRDLSDGKVNAINQVMRLSRDESAKFWPIYHDYEDELFSLGDKRVEMTRSFLKAQTSQSMDNDHAAALAKDWFDAESEQLALLKKYYDKIATELSPVRAAQFAQIEHRFDTVIDLVIASELPFVRAEPAAAARTAAASKN